MERNIQIGDGSVEDRWKDAKPDFPIALRDMHVSEKGLALIHHFEDFKPFAYPDPGSPLYRAKPNAGWGDKPAMSIIQTLPVSQRELSGEPWTVGFGSTRFANGAKVKPTDSVTLEEGAKLFNDTLPKYELIVKGKIKRNLTANEFDAITSFTYNAGSAYKSGNTWRDYNIYHNINQRLEGEAMKNYWRSLAVTSGGVVMGGLVRRRKAEAHLYLTGELNFFS